MPRCGIYRAVGFVLLVGLVASYQLTVNGFGKPPVTFDPLPTTNDLRLTVGSGKDGFEFLSSLNAVNAEITIDRRNGVDFQFLRHVYYAFSHSPLFARIFSLTSRFRSTERFVISLEMPA